MTASTAAATRWTTSTTGLAHQILRMNTAFVASLAGA